MTMNAAATERAGHRHFPLRPQCATRFSDKNRAINRIPLYHPCANSSPIFPPAFMPTYEPSSLPGGTRNPLSTWVMFALLFAVAGTLWGVGDSFYRLGLEARLEHKQYDMLRPSGLVGHGVWHCGNDSHIHEPAVFGQATVPLVSMGFDGGVAKCARVHRSFRQLARVCSIPPFRRAARSPA